jgi:hypothetical protein
MRLVGLANDTEGRAIVVNALFIDATAAATIATM